MLTFGILELQYNEVHLSWSAGWSGVLRRPLRSILERRSILRSGEIFGVALQARSGKTERRYGAHHSGAPLFNALILSLNSANYEAIILKL